MHWLWQVTHGLIRFFIDFFLSREAFVYFLAYFCLIFVGRIELTKRQTRKKKKRFILAQQTMIDARYRVVKNERTHTRNIKLNNSFILPNKKKKLFTRRMFLEMNV